MIDRPSNHLGISPATPPVDFRVAIDVSAVHRSSGGVLRYVQELVRHLPGQRVSPVLIDQRDRPEDPRRRLFDATADTTVLGVAPTSRLPRLAWEQLALTRTVGRLNDVSVLHSPHYTMPRGPAGLDRLARKRRHRHAPASVVTIHDLTFFSLPELHHASKRYLFQSAIRFAAHHADALVCVSDRTASLLRHHVDVRVPVFVAPHGIDAVRFAPPSGETRESDARVLDRLGVRQPYVFWLGAIAPHKNLGNLLQAFDRVQRSNEPAGLSLVIGGQSWPGAWEAVAHLAGAAVQRIGFVGEDDVAPLLRNAAVFAYPSMEEGFGLPVLEALACGTAVLTTEHSVMDDLTGGLATVVDARSVEALADGLRRALDATDSDRVARVARARTFTWEKSAVKHVEAYRVAIGRSRGTM